MATANLRIEKRSEVEGRDQRTGAYEKRDILAQEAMADASVAMAIAACLTFIVTIIGTLLIWKQVALTRKAVEDTANATDAMREANKIAQDLGQSQIRCYLSAPKITTIYADNHWKLSIVIQNSGQTPAIRVSWHPVMCIYVSGESELRSAFGKPIRRGLVIGIAEKDIPAGASESLGVFQIDIPISEEELSHMKCGNPLSIIIEANIKFKDIFGIDHVVLETFSTIISKCPPEQGAVFELERSVRVSLENE